MTVTPPPYRSGQPAGGDGFAQVLRAEWTKFRTVRGSVIGLGAAAVALVLFSLLATSGSRSEVCTGPGPQVCHGSPDLPVGLDGEAVSDTFYFVHQPLAEDGSITIRVTSLTGVISSGNTAHAGGNRLATARPGLQPWAKAGLMVKQSTRQGSRYAAVMVTGSHGARMQHDYTHDTAGTPGLVSARSPRWLRLTRSGDTLAGYDSADGIRWNKIGTARLSGLSSTVQAGLFVTSPNATRSSNPATLATARFDHLSIQGRWPSDTWSGDAIGGDPYYATLSPGEFRHSGDTYTVSGSGDIAPAVAGGASGGETIAPAWPAGSPA
jgi:hypothetical protein